MGNPKSEVRSPKEQTVEVLGKARATALLPGMPRKQEQWFCTVELTRSFGRRSPSRPQTQGTDQIHINDTETVIRRGDDDRGLIRREQHLLRMIHVNRQTVHMDGKPAKRRVFQRCLEVARFHGATVSHGGVKATVAQLGDCWCLPTRLNTA